MVGQEASTEVALLEGLAEGGVCLPPPPPPPLPGAVERKHRMPGGIRRRWGEIWFHRFRSILWPSNSKQEESIAYTKLRTGNRVYGREGRERVRAPSVASRRGALAWAASPTTTMSNHCSRRGQGGRGMDLELWGCCTARRGRNECQPSIRNSKSGMPVDPELGPNKTPPRSTHM